MSGNEKERLISLKSRIKQLEQQLQEQSELINSYESIGNAADQKISAINAINAEKIRSLMNSIQLLKKENAKLKDLQKEHKRSQLIDQLNKEIQDQDLVIQALRDLINDDIRSDAAIVKILNSGPPRIKSLSREELKIENKKLNNQILGLRQQKGINQNEIDNNNNSQLSKTSISTENSNKSQQVMVSGGGDDNVQQGLDANENLIRRIEELKNENDELKLNMKAEQDIRERYESEITRRGQELNDLRSAKTDLIVLNKKYQYLQRQIEDIHQLKTSNEVNQINAELEKEEIQIMNRAQQGKLQAVEKNLRLEVDTLSMKTDQAQRERQEMQQEYSRVLVKYDDLNNRFNDLQQKFMAQRDENTRIKKELEAKTNYYEKQIQNFLNNEVKLQEQIGQRDSIIIEANLKIENQQKNIQDLTNGLRDLEIKLQHIKSPDENEVEIDRQIQELIKKQDVRENYQQISEDDLNKKLRMQREHYERIIQEIQKKLLLTDKKYAADIENISSDLSNLIEKHDNQQDLEEINSDISGSIYQKQQLYGGHFGLIQNQQIENLSSDLQSILDSEERKVDSIEYRDFDSKVSISGSLIQQEQNHMKAPKPQQKINIKNIQQMNSSIASMVSNQSKSQQNNNLDAMSSNVSQFSLKSQVSSAQSKNESKQSSIQNKARQSSKGKR